MMTKKDFKELATICQEINSEQSSEAASKLALKLVSFCRKRNPSFNEPLFLKDCEKKND